MNKEIMNELTELKEVDLIYVNTSTANNKMFINYTIICDMNSVVENIDVCKKIIAVMEIAKTLIAKENIVFNYNIKTSNTLENEIKRNNKGVIYNLETAKVLYQKDYYFKDLLEEKKNKTR